MYALQGGKTTDGIQSFYSGIPEMLIDREDDLW